MLHITSGRGPAECCRAVELLTGALATEAARTGLTATLLESTPGPRPGTMASALLLVEGEGASALAACCSGTVRWVCKSPYRPGHNRKNWHVGVCRLELPAAATLDERDIRYDTYRSGGSGGQHVNTTDSAVRAVHLPSGIATVARSERSQHQNRRKALRQLQALFEFRRHAAAAEAESDRWALHNGLERGNPIRTYCGEDFRRVG